MPGMTTRPVFIDDQAIGEAHSVDEAVRVLRGYALSRHATAGLSALLDDFGIEHPEKWRARRHLSEAPDGFYFHLRTLKGDIP